MEHPPHARNADETETHPDLPMMLSVGLIGVKGISSVARGERPEKGASSMIAGVPGSHGRASFTLSKLGRIHARKTRCGIPPMACGDCRISVWDTDVHSV
jgi:hypothetical protein